MPHSVGSAILRTTGLAPLLVLFLLLFRCAENFVYAWNRYQLHQQRAFVFPFIDSGSLTIPKLVRLEFGGEIGYDSVDEELLFV